MSTLAGPAAAHSRPPLFVTQNPAALSRAQSDTLARELFEHLLADIQKLEPNADKIRVLSALAQRIGAAGKPDWAAPLFTAALQLTTPDPPLDIYEQAHMDALRRDVLRGMVSGGLSDRALELVPTLKTALYQAELLNAIATAQLNAGQVDTAQPLVMQALQLARGVDNTSFAYEANGSCANEKYAVLVEIADNLSRLGNFSQALATATQVHSCYAAAMPYAPYEPYQAQVFFNLLDRVQTRSELAWLWQASLKLPDPAEQSAVWTAIAHQSAQWGNAKQVLAIAAQLTTAPVPGEPVLVQSHWRQQFSTLSRLSMQLHQQGETQAAQQLDLYRRTIVTQLQTWERNHPDLLPYTHPSGDLAIQFLLLDEAQSAIAQAQHQSAQGQQTDAIATLTQAWQTLNAVEPETSTPTRQNLIMALAELGDRDHAIAWTATLPAPTRQLTHLDLTLAEQDAAQIVAIIRELTATPAPDNSVILFTVCNRLMNIESPTLAHLDKTWQVWQALDLEAQSWQSRQLQTFLTSAYIRLGERDRGLQILGDSRDPTVLTAAIHALIGQGAFTEAAALIQKIPREPAPLDYYYHAALEDLVVHLLTPEDSPVP